MASAGVPWLEVDGVTADQRMLDYLITHCVTNSMKEQAAEQLGDVSETPGP